MMSAWGGKTQKCPVPSPSVWQVRKCKEQTVCSSFLGISVFGFSSIEKLNRKTGQHICSIGRTMVHHAMEPLLGKGLGKTCRIPLLVLVHPLNVWNSIGNKHCHDVLHIKTQGVSRDALKMEDIWKTILSFYKWIYMVPFLM